MSVSDLEQRVDRLLDQFAAYERGEGDKPHVGETELKMMRRYKVLLERREGGILARQEAINHRLAHLRQQESMVNDPSNHFVRTIDGHDHKWPIMVNTPTLGRGAILKAHEILEQANSPTAEFLCERLGEKQPALSQIIRECHAITHALMQSQKFDLRAVQQEDIAANAEFAKNLANEGLFHLPFPVVWYEWEIHPSISVGLLAVETDCGVAQRVFGRMKDHGWSSWDEIIGPHAEEVLLGASVLITSRCSEKRPVHAPDRLNMRRMQRGAPPLFSHTVIEICGLKIHNETGMVVGERRSPRMHWRKGHIRHFRNPEGAVIHKVAIAPMLIGRQELGTVEHSYKVGAAHA